MKRLLQTLLLRCNPNDPFSSSKMTVLQVMKIETEEGKKVAREGKFGFVKYVTAFRRIKRQRE